MATRPDTFGHEEDVGRHDALATGKEEAKPGVGGSGCVQKRGSGKSSSLIALNVVVKHDGKMVLYNIYVYVYIYVSVWMML